MEIKFGALCDPLHKQLDVPPSILEEEQKIAESLFYLHLECIITTNEYNNGLKRLVKRIRRIVKESK